MQNAAAAGSVVFAFRYQQHVKSWFCIDLIVFGEFGNIAIFAK